MAAHTIHSAQPMYTLPRSLTLHGPNLSHFPSLCYSQISERLLPCPAFPSAASPCSSPISRGRGPPMQAMRPRRAASIRWLSIRQSSGELSPGSDGSGGALSSFSPTGLTPSSQAGGMRYCLADAMVPYFIWRFFQADLLCMRRIRRKSSSQWLDVIFPYQIR